ncbi:MAG TPA: VOC family protein [Haliangium sp.]|nr:VOC family protein [Haliangium sp.]
MHTPLGRLAYLYVGSASHDADVAYYRDVLGGELVWHFDKFGARVAAFRLAEGPLVLLADHRPAGTCLPIFGVRDLQAVVRELRGRGWQASGGPFEIPDGPCYLFRDPSGNELGLLGLARPDALVAAYADPGNSAALRTIDEEEGEDDDLPG